MVDLSGRYPSLAQLSYHLGNLAELLRAEVGGYW